jgi:hypothetical protein
VVSAPAAISSCVVKTGTSIGLSTAPAKQRFRQIMNRLAPFRQAEIMIGQHRFTVQCFVQLSQSANHIILYASSAARLILPNFGSFSVGSDPPLQVFWSGQLAANRRCRRKPVNDTRGQGVEEAEVAFALTCTGARSESVLASAAVASSRMRLRCCTSKGGLAPAVRMEFVQDEKAQSLRRSDELFFVDPRED